MMSGRPRPPTYRGTHDVRDKKVHGKEIDGMEIHGKQAGMPAMQRET
jgi:hypothetical protein